MLSLDYIKEKSAEIEVSFSNSWINSTFDGSKFNYDDLMRVTYLSGIVDAAWISGTTVYLGATIVTDAYITDTFQKLSHYDRVSVDLSDYDEIVADDGEGGAVSSGGTTVSTDTYRSGNMTVSAGANPVTFIKNGVASPLSSSDYTVEAWVISNSGYRQNNVVVTGQVAAGFVASDVLEAGTLYYIATLNT